MSGLFRYRFPLGVLACLVALSASAAPAKFTLTEAGGERVFDSEKSKGSYVVLHFLLKTECPVCLRYTQEYSSKAYTIPGIVQVFIKPDTEAEIKEWSANLVPGKEPSPVIYRDPDAKLAKAFEIPDGYAFHGQTVHYPALVLLDPAGKEVFRYVGKKNTDRFDIAKLRDKLVEIGGPEAKSANAADGVALHGFDPVAYLNDNKAVAGDANIESVFRGVKYRFSSVGNARAFAKSPETFVPAYGGWCALGIANGQKFDVDPANFKIVDGRVCLFGKSADADALAMWTQDEAALKPKADAAWMGMSATK